MVVTDRFHCISLLWLWLQRLSNCESKCIFTISYNLITLMEPMHAPRRWRSVQLRSMSLAIWFKVLCNYWIVYCIRQCSVFCPPADTFRHNNVVVTPKRCHFGAITSKGLRFDVITTFLLRNVFGGSGHSDGLRSLTGFNTQTNICLEISMEPSFWGGSDPVL